MLFQDFCLTHIKTKCVYMLIKLCLTVVAMSLVHVRGTVALNPCSAYMAPCTQYITIFVPQVPIRDLVKFPAHQKQLLSAA